MTRAQSAVNPQLDGTRSFQGPSITLDVAATSGHDSEPEVLSPSEDLAALRHEWFQIGAKLGEGGMGVVYRARDARDGREIALKLMKGALAGIARRRFEREFRSLSALRHPHCLGVYDYGELAGGPFFTMELFLGRPITSLAGRSLPEVLDALLQLTHAVDYIHGHGIVHRDIKPSNILVRPQTRADGSNHFETRLMDFGLAKYYGVKTSLSAEAGFVGTVAYCAPEQINLDELDHRADLYCLGLVSYELLSGRYVFPEARLAGMRPLIQAHLNDKPRPLAEVAPEVPSPIADVVMKYLRKQPQKRPNSAGVLRAAIASYLGIDEQSMVSGAAQSLVKLQAIVNNHRGELLRIAPELRKYLPGEAYQQVDFGSEADYIHRALSALFLEIAAVQPMCLSFEDLQWADKSSLDLLRHLAAALAESRRSGSADPSTSTARLIIVASARTGYGQLEALLAQLRDCRQVLDIRLAPLVEIETRELIALRLNCQPEHLSDELVARVHGLCGGNPFFVAETVSDWYEKDAITRSENGWVPATAATDTSDLPETVRDVMRLRLQGLPPKVQQVVSAAAVIGAVVDVDLLNEALPDLSESDVLDAIDLLIPRRVFRETGNAGRVEFVHDLLRELPYADLTASRRRSLHRRVGELLEQRREKGRAVAAAVLADHFRSAEDPSKAFTYTVEAAETALEAYAFHNAIGQLTRAQKLLPDNADAATRYNLWKLLGMACGSSGRSDDAIAAYTQALTHAKDRIARATAEVGIGENDHRKGLFDEALRHLDIALKEVGYQRQTSVVGRMLGT